MDNLSCYILTKNSAQYLEVILQKIESVVDEIIIVDSGSADSTKEIAQKFSKVKFVFHAFSNFKEQRNYAAQICTYAHVLFLDSDEIPDDLFIKEIQKIKSLGFTSDVYDVARKWIVLGKEIRCIYPIVSPDFPIRLIDKCKVSFKENSNWVHETPSGYTTRTTIAGCILHQTFHQQEELDRKLEQYTDIAAQDLIRNKRPVHGTKLIFSPIAAFFKWYLSKEGYKDGRVGFILGKYAYNYTRKKYCKARKMLAKR